MTKMSKSRGSAEAFFARHPVLTTDSWACVLGGRSATTRAREMARYYTRTGRLRRLARGVYAVVPPGTDPDRFTPDPYLVGAALRQDAILSHHAALDLLGVSRSVFRRFTFFTGIVRRPLRVAGLEWHALAQPQALVRTGQVQFGTTSVDRQGVVVRLTGPERTLVDGFAGLKWAGGLEEQVQSASAFRDLDLDIVEQYLRLLDRAILHAAVGWFLEQHPETANPDPSFLAMLARRAPRRPLYLGRRRKGARVLPRWNLLVPAHLLARERFEGAGA